MKQRLLLLLIASVLIGIFGALSAKLAPVEAQCTVRTDWPVYTVQRGDTLARIARRYNTTVATLVSANCLTNANRIYTGQPIRVPYSSGTIPPSSDIGSTFQPFERGFMTWRADTGEIVVYSFAAGSTTNGIVSSYPAPTYVSLPDNPVTDPTPAGRVRPIFGFGKVWGNYSAVRSNLGWATATESGYLMNMRPEAGGYRFSLPNGALVLNSGNRTWTLVSGSVPGGGTTGGSSGGSTGGSTGGGTGTITVLASFQLFEYGFMTWRADTSEIVVYYNTASNAGGIISYPSSSYAYLPDNPVTDPTPTGRIRPILGFGKVWGHYAAVRSNIGWGLTGEQTYNMIVTSSAGSYQFSIPNGSVVRNTGNQTWSVVSGSGPASVPRPSGAGTTVSGSITFWPYVAFIPNTFSYLLHNGQTVAVRWDTPAAGSISVRFVQTNADGSSVTLGTDSDFSDGASITWVVPNNVNVTITAYSFGPDNVPLTRSNIINVSSAPVNITTTYGAFQQYETGFMIWRQDTQDIWTFFNGGALSIYLLSSYSGLPDNPVPDPTPAGRIRPISGFGRVWGNYTQVRTALGWATAAESGYHISLRPVPTNSGAQICFNIPDGRFVQFVTTQGSTSTTWQFVNTCG
ncbi:MAG: LysM peptidoglycan-binding domain-containing protein [Chloroflexi bacterium]|nr:LysM peptidoglycan-binding domain-containing protein [Chloroflexota bacterium]